MRKRTNTHGASIGPVLFRYCWYECVEVWIFLVTLGENILSTSQREKETEVQGG